MANIKIVESISSILLPTSNGIKNHARTQFDKLDMERTSTLSKNPF